MKSLIFAAVAASAMLAAGVSPAAAIDYPYCIQGTNWGYPGNCQFTTYEQCRASASGTDAGCGVNPVAAFAQQREKEPRYPARAIR